MTVILTVVIVVHGGRRGEFGSCARLLMDGSCLVDAIPQTVAREVMVAILASVQHIS